MADRPSPDIELVALASEAAAAPPGDLVVRYRQAFSRFGAEGINALAPLLADDQRRHSVAIMIREMAKAGLDEQSAGCSAVVGALRDVRPSGQAFLVDTLEKMGCEAPDSVFPPGTRFTPISGPITAHHAVVDVIPNSSTRFRTLYMVACHWVFTASWVSEHGGLLTGHEGRYCWACSRALGEPRAQ